MNLGVGGPLTGRNTASELAGYTGLKQKGCLDAKDSLKSALMRAMLLTKIGPLDENPSPLSLVDWPQPKPGVDDLLIRVSVCGVCHTELDEIEGRLPPKRLPIILGHQAVGRVHTIGTHVRDFQIGQRVGVAWIFSACGICQYCKRGEENLCPQFAATGRDANGGYAEYMTVPTAFAHPIPEGLTDAQTAPLLCAGAVGFRSLRLTGLKDGQNLGFTGFGASAHLVLQLAKHQYPNSQFFVFARSDKERDFAKRLGANWAGDTEDMPPELLHAIIDTTPAWMPIVAALANLESGGRLVINAIRKEETDKQSLLKLQYPQHLWMEKEIKSVANVTRLDVREFLRLASEIPIQPEIEEYDLKDANRALNDLKSRNIRGAKVLRIG
jgi:propanol-preferring alcohol dehydrogenase